MKKQNIIMGISFVLLFVMVIGVSYAAYKFSAAGTKENVISTGTISMSYSQNSFIDLKHTYPKTDIYAIGTKEDKSSMEFSVSMETSGTKQINYALAITNIEEGTTLKSDKVKIYLEKEGKVVNNFETNKGKTIESFKNKYVEGLIDSYAIYQDILTTSNKTHHYTLTAWIDESYILPIKNETTTTKQTNEETYKFKVKVVGVDTSITIEEKSTVSSLDTSGANAPVLASNMIPVYYDETSGVWKKADKNNKDNNNRWYSYESSGEYKGMWANAVTVKDTNRQTYLNATPGTIIPMDDINTMWVWIPRFKVNTTDFTLIRGKDSGYCEDGEGRTTNTKEECEKLGSGIYWVSHYKNPGAIDITFVKENEKAIDSFTFGDKELSGFWFAKFATSHSTLSSSTIDNNLGCTNETCSNANGIIIKPNVTSLRYNNISNFFYASRSMEQTGNSFGFVSSEVDTHMSKNNEWGVVVYLTHSIYGRCNNSTNCVNVSRSSNEVYNTTSGKDTSTTGTIYGVYNMNDGKKEYVMGVLADTNGNPRSGDNSSQTSGFTGMEYNGTMYTGVPFPDSKYYNLYSGNYYEESAQIGSKYIGHALKETDSWYDERIGYMQSTPLSNMYPWVLRNWNLGMFNVWHTTGYYYNSMVDSSYSSARFVITNE